MVGTTKRLVWSPRDACQVNATQQQDRAYRSTPTSEALLVAARREFAEHGMGGARVERIAVAAGVNKQRIYGYFGSKERLFDLVVAQAVEDIMDAIPLGEDGDLGDHALKSIAHHLVSDDLARLLFWESLWYRDREMPMSDSRLAVYRRKVEAMSQLLGRAVDERTAAALFLLIGIASWVPIMGPLAQLIRGDGDAAAFDANVLDLAAGMARSPAN
jgi:AcrR family transcriptional regulator